MIVADTSGLLAYFNASEPSHGRVTAAVNDSNDPLVVSPFVLAELDHLLASRHGVEAEVRVLEELAQGSWLLPPFSADDLGRAAELVTRYGDQKIGLTDASLVVLAQRFATRRILTLDRRQFEVVRPVDGGRFTILPS
jgi:hypothetical protein